MFRIHIFVLSKLLVLEFSFTKESKEIIIDKHKYISEQIKNLEDTVYTTDNGFEIKVRHVLQFTMVDGKVAQAISGNKASSSCTVCHATQKQYNMPNYEFQDIESTYEFGLSPLHARIRFMEHCLKISYDIEFQEYVKNNPNFNTKNAKEKTIIKQQFRTAAKKQIQDNFREAIGLIIDTPKQGFGNTNDGNTARRFFQNTKLTSEITKIDEKLLIRFKKNSCCY